jgi:hypothetical protein
MIYTHLKYQNLLEQSIYTLKNERKVKPLSEGFIVVGMGRVNREGEG